MGWCWFGVQKDHTRTHMHMCIRCTRPCMPTVLVPKYEHEHCIATPAPTAQHIPHAPHFTHPFVVSVLVLEAPFLPFLPELNAVADVDFFTAAPTFFLTPPPAFLPLGGMLATLRYALVRRTSPAPRSPTPSGV